MQINNAALNAKAMQPFARKPIPTQASLPAQAGLPGKVVPNGIGPSGQLPTQANAPAKIVLAPGAKPPPVDLNTILQNWGTSNGFADLNADGIVDAHDLAIALHAHLGGGDGGVAGGSDDDGWSGVAGGDHNGDGVVDARDLAISLNGSQPAGGGEDDGWAGVAGGDHNGDGVVDARDLAISLNNAQGGSGEDWSGVVSGDLNGDGVVDAFDLAISLNGMQAKSASVSADAEAGEPALVDPTLATAAGLQDALPAPDAGTIQVRAVEELVNRILKTLDQDGDGALAPKDLAQTPSLFRRFDADGSGLITREELTKGLLEEFGRFAAARPEADPASFSKRWMDAFSGMRRMPDYIASQKVGELFAPQRVPTAQTASTILSAKA